MNMSLYALLYNTKNIHIQYTKVRAVPYGYVHENNILVQIYGKPCKLNNKMNI